MAGTVVSAGIVSGDLIIGLDSGELINAGRVQGPAGLRGPDGPPGPNGKDGADGNTILSSRGMPKPDQGKEGDFVIDVNDWVIYGPKAGDNASWGQGQPLLAERMNPRGALSHSDRLGAGGGRFFPVGGVSSGVTVSAGGTGLDPIQGNRLPLAANTPTLIASDAAGDLIKVILYMRNATHTYSTEVVVMRAGAAAAWSSAWEAAVPTTGAPTVDFVAQVNGAELQLLVESDAAWDEIRGVVILV